MMLVKDKLPLVSIVCPIYKPNYQFFTEMLKSINNQTYPQIEIIISNDENIEELQILREVKHPLTYVKNCTGKHGIFANLNNAIRFCKGRFVQVLCQDDIMYPSMIANLAKKLDMHAGAGMIFSQFDYADENGNIKNLESRYSIRQRWMAEMPAKKGINYFLAFGCMPGNLSSVMLTKEVFAKCGFFNQSYPYAGDFEFWVRIAEHYDILYIKESNLAIRRHNAQASKTIKFNQLMNDRRRIYTTLLKKNTIEKSKRYLLWYVNQEVGVQQLFYVLKHWKYFFEKGNTPSMLNAYPVSFFKSLILLLTTFNGRIRIFNLHPEEL